MIGHSRISSANISTIFRVLSQDKYTKLFSKFQDTTEMGESVTAPSPTLGTEGGSPFQQQSDNAACSFDVNFFEIRNFGTGEE